MRFASSAPKKKMLLCQDQLTSKPKKMSSTDTDNTADGLLDATLDEEGEDRRPAERAKSQRQVLDERLAKIRKKELKAREKALQERRQDLPAKALDSTSYASRGGGLSGEVEQRTEISSRERLQPPTQQDRLNTSGNATARSSTSQPPPDPAETRPVQSHMQQPGHGLRPEDKVNDDFTRRSDLLEGGDTTQETAVQQEHKSAPKRKKVGIGRKEIRQSASSCYRKPDEQEQSTKAMDADTDTTSFPARAQSLISAEGQPAPATTDDLQLSAPKDFQRVISDSNNHEGPKQKRTPGAPMKITPSPSKQPPQSFPGGDANVSRTSLQAPNPVHQRPSEAHLSTADTPTAPPPPPPQQKKFIQPLPRPTRSTVRLNTSSEGTATVMLGRPFQPPKPPVPKAKSEEAAIPTGAADPWSREAFDLFEWRPPNWDEERWCFKE
ncbi:hypothetical protein KC343_g14165 [Hortaea werneckii]|nr:hypothetical protein KC352_g28005 [Hortaea werneckii]KAI7598014.1 hypothetical protein KC346_g14427 [Hortaea werneckii]KAI7604285.1 hypothetical protein KC343_g14165 [Hortaea werneckii]